MARVLVADDSETILLLLRTQARDGGLRGGDRADGQEVVDAMQRAPSARPDVLLLDAMMPRKSGIDALRELRAGGVETPALIVSAHQDEMDAGAATRPRVERLRHQADRLRPALRQHRRADRLGDCELSSSRPRAGSPCP